MFDKNNKNGSGCFSEEELISYLYGEMGESNRVKLDIHLAGCPSCTEEFAGISESRFSVYEWQKAAFVDLKTPKIHGPWQEPDIEEAKNYDAPETVPWIDRIRTALVLRPGFAWAASALALLVFAIGAGFLILRNNAPSTNLANDKTNPVAITPSSEKSPEVAKGAEINNNDTTSRDKQTANRVSQPAPRYLKSPVITQTAYGHNRVQKLRNETASNTSKEDLRRYGRRVPRLGDFDEEEDSSVRLADLVAESDTDK